MSEYWILIIFIFLIWLLIFTIYKEKQRTRLLTAFIAGIIKEIVYINNRMDKFEKLELEERPDHYQKVLGIIKREFEGDYWVGQWEQFAKSKRFLFWEENSGGDGFHNVFLIFIPRYLKNGTACNVVKWVKILMNSEGSSSFTLM